MAFTLGGQPISKASYREPRYGVPAAEVAFQTVPSALAAGQRATLVLGDLSRVGTLLPGGAFGGVASFGWVAGAGRWGTTVKARTYRDDAGVMLSAVLADLAADAGELGAVLDGVPDRALGYAWTRPAGVASDLLRALVGDAWWIAADGITHTGPRPSSSAAPTDIAVDPYDPALRRGVVVLAGDEYAQLLPGTTLTAQGLPAPLLVGELELHVEPAHVEAVLWGERPAPELASLVIEALARRYRYAGTAPMRVSAVASSRTTVEPADARAADLDGHPFLDAVYGLPGASAVLQKGATVLVAWPGQDPGSPVLVGWFPDVLPASLSLSAVSELDVLAALVQLGGKGGKPVVVDDGLQIWLEAVRIACQAAGHDPGAPPTIAATKVTAV